MSSRADKSKDKKLPLRLTKNFRKPFDELEQQRSMLLERLETLGEKAAAHPANKRALTLLNATFRKAPLAQRLAVLQAAAWLIDLLEKLTVLS